MNGGQQRCPNRETRMWNMPRQDTGIADSETRRWGSASRSRCARALLYGASSRLAIVLASCQPTNDSLRQRELRDSVNPWPRYSFLFVAEELRYFQARGLDLRLMELESLADSRRIFEQVNTDVIGRRLVSPPQKKTVVVHDQT